MAQLRKNPQVLANFITGLEKLYPGGTYAFLGRDSAYLHDLVDAFYISIGQPGRTVRLDASGETIRSTNNEGRMKFLMSNGLDPQDLEKGYPYIMIDATQFSKSSGGHTSQSQQLLESVYEYLEANGFKGRQLINKVNFVNIKSDMYKGFNFLGMMKKPKEIDQLMKEIQVVSTKNGPETIWTIDAAILSYGDIDWHNKFGVMKFKGNAAYAEPIGKHSDEVKKQILGEQYQMLNLVSSEKFKDLVQETAKSLEFEFPFAGRPAPKKIDPTIPGTSEPDAISRLLARLGFVYTEMSVLNTQTHALRLSKELISHGKKDPVSFYLKVLDSGVIHNHKANLAFPKLEVEFGSIFKDLAANTHDYAGLLQLASLYSSKYMAQNVVTILPYIKDVKHFLQMVKSLPEGYLKTPSDATTAAILAFFELGPDTAALQEFMNFITEEQFLEFKFANLFMNKTPDEFLNALDQAGPLNDTDIDMLANKFIRYHLKSYHFTKFKAIVGRQTLHSSALFELILSQNPYEYISVAKKYSGDPKLLSDVVDLTLYRFVDRNPSLQDIAALNSQLKVFNEHTQLSLFKYASKYLGRTEDLITLLSHPSWADQNSKCGSSKTYQSTTHLNHL